MRINELVKEAHENAVKHGWWETERSFGEQIALMHSELSEALEEFRNGHNTTEIYTKCKMNEIKAVGGGGCGVCKNCPVNKPEGIPIELADCIIRIFDTCGKYGIDLENALKIKMEYNKNRPYKHGNKVI
jgi:NTP pyrophosphatase (non-canonical NTP hydrolase)